MPNIELDVPVYKINCLKCGKEQFLRFRDMVWEKVVHCPDPCYESIDLAGQYRRAELEDIAERLGIPRNFTGYNDDQSGEIPAI